MEFDFVKSLTVRFDDKDPKRCSSSCCGYIATEDEYDLCLYFDGAHLERLDPEYALGFRCKECIEEQSRLKHGGMSLRPDLEKKRT